MPETILVTLGEIPVFWAIGGASRTGIATPRERSRTRIAPLGHSAVARRARLLAKSGYFITVAQNTGISPKTTGVVSGIATGGGLGS